MGAFSFFSFFFKLLSTSSNSDTRILKKRKTSSFMEPIPLHSRSSASSRVHRYPKPESRIPRSVHAPCRTPRFSFCSSSSPELGVKKDEEVIDVDEMGNSSSLSAKIANVKKLKESALGSLRYVIKKDEEVIDVDRGYIKKDEEVIDVDRGYIKKDVEVIDVDRVVDRRVDRGYVSGNSIGEEVVEVVGDGSEWRSQEENGKVVVVEHYLDLTNLMEKRIGSLSLDRKLDGPVHKKLFEDAERHNRKLKSLSSEIEINEKEWAALQSLSTAKKPQREDVLPDEAFVPLTEEEKAEVSVAFSNSSRRKVLTTHEDSNIEITGELLQCLRPRAWLNDEVINLYLELLKEREKREPKKFLKCHFFNTFFYKKLMGGRNGYDFKSVKRWTNQRKLGYCLRDCDKIFVPIHKEIHWCLAVINKKDEKFQYLDSQKGIDTQVLQVLARYFVDEVKDKSGKDIDVHSWMQEIVEDLPEQKNGWDCGMFMIKYADFYSRGLGLHFKQEHMPYFRQRTAKEILRLKAQ